MKSSIYNIFLSLKGEYVLFNTLTNSLLLVDADMKNIIEGKLFHVLSEDQRECLVSLGVLVEDKVDERIIYADLYNRLVYSNRDLRFVIITTYACNLACPYCYEGMREMHGESMDEVMAEQIIKAIKDKIISEGVKGFKIMLFGGEPLLNQDIGLKIFYELSSWSKDNSLRMEGAMVTNGTLVNQSVIEKFRPYLHTVQLTFDGPKPYHDKKRIHKDGRGTYDEVLGALKSFRAAGISVSLRIQVASDNVHCLGDILKNLRIEGLLEDQGIRLSMFPLKRLTEMCSNYDCFLEEDDLGAMINIWEHEPNQTPQTRILPCHVYSGLYIINPFGDVYKCISAVGKKNDAVGTAKGGVLKLYNSYYDFMTRDPLEMAECACCAYLPICGGGCPHMAKQNSGIYNTPYCGSTKALVDKKVLYYLDRKTSM